LQLRDQIRTAMGSAAPAEPPAAPPESRPAVSNPASILAGDARAALIARLASEPPGTTWLSYDARDPAAQRMANDLAAAFKDARWTVRSVTPIGFPIRPGIFLFVADEPSATTQAVDEALDRAGLTHTLGTGYRDFSADRRRADPNWKGIDFATGQEFLLVVGRQVVPPP